MAFYQPTRQQHDVDPKLVILIVAIFLTLMSLFVVASFQNTKSKDRSVPDFVIAGNLKTPTDFTKLQGNATFTYPVIFATVRSSPLEAALNDLLKRPRSSGDYSEIPKGTQLLGVSVYNNTVTVNLSEEFASGGGSTSMIQRVEELKKTVAAFGKNYKLKISIHGKPIQYLGGEGLELG